MSATNKNGVSFIHLHSQNLSLHAQMHHGGINLNDFSSTCICLQLLHMSSVSWVLRNRYTLVSKSVSAVDRKGNKIIILLYGIVQIIYWESWSKRVYLVCRYVYWRCGLLLDDGSFDWWWMTTMIFVAFSCSFTVANNFTCVS